MLKVSRSSGSRRFVLPVILLLLLSLLSAACDSVEDEKLPVADYGKDGSQFARRFARTYPGRGPGSDQEHAAGDFIIKTLKEMGYAPVVTTFTLPVEPMEDQEPESAADDTDITVQKAPSSRNIAVFVEGKGFTRTGVDGQQTRFRKQVIIGAHYDTPVSIEEIEAAAAETKATESEKPSGGSGPSLAEYTGIQDNASGVAALMTIARELKNYDLGYDVVLVAFGAGSADQAGSRFFAGQLSRAEIAATDAMYCIDSIYAGDKVYAHSGRNSILGGDRKDYEKRRKLYEATDVFFENLLYSNNRYMLYTNQSSFLMELEGYAEPVVYREWSLNDSDYLPFDELGIPIVFFESYDYDEKSVAEMKESHNPAFGATNGRIRGTGFDSTDFLEQLLNSTRSSAARVTDRPLDDQLTRRINNTAFIILEALAKGNHDADAR
ncbi:MAG: M28 family peptidase [Saccharofermentanales bacterium]|nr:Zn-dependent exopeptidase M28 [Clostridiaceae bacterium]